MSQVAIIGILGLVMMCSSSASLAAVLMMGGDEKTTSTTAPTRSPGPSPGPAPAPTPAPAPAPTPAPAPANLPITTNGRCGAAFGNTRCGGKACCSQWNWCGGEQGIQSAWCVGTTKGHWNGKYDGTG